MNDAINKEKRKYSILLISLSIVLVISIFISLCIGRYSIKIGEVIFYLFNKSINPTSYNVINNPPLYGKYYNDYLLRTLLYNKLQKTDIGDRICH